MLLWKAVRTGERKSFIWSSLTLFHLLELMDFWSTARFPFKSWQIVFPSSTHSMWNFKWWPSTQREKPIEKTVHKTHKHQISAVWNNNGQKVLPDRSVLIRQKMMENAKTQINMRLFGRYDEILGIQQSRDFTPFPGIRLG